MQGWRTAILVTVLVVVGAAMPAAAGRLVVQESAGRLTVEADDVPLLKVLAEMARYTEAEIFISESLATTPVSVSVAGLPVDRALQKVLRSYDFLASFKKTSSGESRLRLVKVYPRGNRRGNLAKVHARSGPAVERGAQRTFAAAVGRSSRQGPVAVPGSVLSGTHSNVARRPTTVARTAASRPRPARDVGMALDLVEQDLLHEEWRLSRATKTGPEPEQHAAVLAATGVEQQMTAARRDALLSSLQRLQYLQDSTAGDTFAVTLPR